MFTGLDNDAYDGVLSPSLPDGASAGNYLLSNPYFLLGPVLVTSPTSPLKSLKDLSGKRIGVINNSRSLFALNKDPTLNFVFYDYSDRLNFLTDLTNGQLDGMLLDKMTADEFTHSPLYTNQFHISSAPLTNEGLRLIVKNSPDNQILIDKFNKGLAQAQKNGEYAKLLNKWSLFSPVSP